MQSLITYLNDVSAASSRKCIILMCFHSCQFKQFTFFKAIEAQDIAKVISMWHSRSVILRARKNKIRQHTSVKLSSLLCPFEQTHKKVCQNGSYDEYPCNHILFTTFSSPQTNGFTTTSTCNCYIGSNA